MNFLENDSIQQNMDANTLFNFTHVTSLKRANTASSSELSSCYFDDLSKGEYALKSQPELTAKSSKKNIFKSPSKDNLKIRRRASCFLKGSKKRRINLKKQIRKSVQKFRNQSRSKFSNKVKKLKHLGFEINNLIIPSRKDKESDSSEDGSDESIKTRKKYLTRKKTVRRRTRPKNLKEKLKIQKQKVKLQLKEKIFRKMKGGGYKKKKKTKSDLKLKSFIYDNAIVNKDSKTGEGIILYQTGEIYYGKLNVKNRPNGLGIVFSNEGDFLYGKFDMGVLNGKVITNDQKYDPESQGIPKQDSEWYIYKILI